MPTEQGGINDAWCDAGAENAVHGAAVLTGANAVPIPVAKAQQIAA